MDIVFIRDLRVEARIGVWDWEQKIRQVVSIDLEMGADNRTAAATDDIADTLDYKAVSRRIVAFVEGHDFHLVETLAERIAELIREEFSIPWLRLCLSKPGAVRGAREVGVIIERGERAAG
ncbi:MAG: dihydroneopterin aldolase [Pseudomonadota bacterium]|nr:dihydroneopterin aldolase [Pseudomonadota bacterium]